MFVKGVSRELQNFLVAKLELGSERGSERCRAWLAEDPAVAARRTKLQSRKATLETLLAKLDAA